MREVKERIVTVQVRGRNIEFLEKYVVDENGEELFSRNIEIENDTRLYNEYKLQMGLLLELSDVELKESPCCDIKHWEPQLQHFLH